MPLGQVGIEQRLAKMAASARKIQAEAEAIDLAGALPDVDPSSLPISLTAPPPSPLMENKR